MSFRDLTGQRFGRLTVLEIAGRTKYRAIIWKCKCDCGNYKSVYAGHLVSGKIRSCGCYMNESRIERATTHGMSNTKLYNAWRAMRTRCKLPTCKSYKNYGARGIKVCDEWDKSFENFYNYVSQLPHFGEEGYSLDRINNEGNYEPNNVRWATRKEQANNRRKAKI